MRGLPPQQSCKSSIAIGSSAVTVPKCVGPLHWQRGIEILRSGRITQEGNMGQRMSAIITTVVATALPYIFGAALTLQLPVTFAFAEGAVALGRPADIAKAGVAIGISANYADNTAATKRALEECQTTRDAPQETRSLCRLLAYFKDQCAAVTIDKKAGTPGFGWSIGINKASAQKEAMAACKATAGKSREAFCEQIIVYCDGTARQP
jgi:hypothetical protein